MKKIIAIIVICLMLCGCSKDEPKASTPTQEPSNKITSIESITPTLSDDELLKEIYDKVDASRLSLTQSNYDAMVSAANISLASEAVLKELAQLGDGFITMGPDGIKFDNIGPEMQKSLESIIGKLSDLKFYQECIIKVDGHGVISREQEPGAKPKDAAPATKPEQEELYIEYVKSELEKTPYKDNYSVKKDGYVIVISIWKDGFADKIASLQGSNNQNDKDEYEAIKFELGKMAKDFDNKIFDYEIDYCHTALYLVNDKNTVQYLIAWADGEFHSENNLTK